MPKVAMISLGCPKNLVDGEQMLSRLVDAGYEITLNPDESDIMVLNTCGFIDEAREEAIENLIELTQMKRDGLIKHIIVTGCLVQREKEDIAREFPEVDALLGTGSYHEIANAAEKVLAGEEPRYFGDIDAPVAECGRVLSTPSYTAYIKIAEGCDNRCSYCVIPSLRGRFRSRRREDILSECRMLGENGVREFIIVAQDISRYGLDLYGKRCLDELLRDIAAIGGVRWIRLHYLYPDGMTDGLIDAIRTEPKICRYLDIPIQHISDRILRAMNRRGTGEEIRELFAKLRSEIPGVVLRTSLIAGLPGETDAEFEELCEFLRESGIERAGVFAYSPQDGTPAAAMPGQIDDETKEHRRELLSSIAERNMAKHFATFVGKEVEVLTEGFDKFAGVSFGRTRYDSPEIDGVVFIRSKKPLAPGKFVTARITGDEDGETFAELVSDGGEGA